MAQRAAQAQPALNPDPLYSTAEAAAFLSVSRKTAENWRWRGIGPAYIKVGDRCVRYRLSALEAFIAAGAS